MVVGEIFVVEADRSSPFFKLTEKQLSFQGLSRTGEHRQDVFQDRFGFGERQPLN
jgi:hypothetical protein